MKITYDQLQRVLEDEARGLASRMRDARIVAAIQGSEVVKRKIPKAFGILRDSVEPSEFGIKVSAPHAAAVEIGTRPHMPNIEALIRWVKLRGMQGLTKRGQLRKSFKNMSPKAVRQAQTVARRLRSLRNGQPSSDIDAPRQIAEAIAHRIAKYGTKPVFYMGSSVPSISKNLLRLMKKLKRA